MEEDYKKYNRELITQATKLYGLVKENDPDKNDMSTVVIMRIPNSIDEGSRENAISFVSGSFVSVAEIMVDFFTRHSQLFTIVMLEMLRMKGTEVKVINNKEELEEALNEHRENGKTELH